MTDPIQNGRIIADIARLNPSNQPIPKTILPSPKPIHLPFDINHSRINGKASIGPDKSDSHEGMTIDKSGDINKCSNARVLNVYDSASGIILCLIS